jgi:hypothetical protein
MIYYYIKTNLLIATFIIVFSFLNYIFLTVYDDNNKIRELSYYKKVQYIKNKLSIKLRNNYNNLFSFFIITYMLTLSYPYFLFKSIKENDIFKLLDYYKMLHLKSFSNCSLEEINNEVLELKNIVKAIQQQDLKLEERIKTDRWIVNLDNLENNLQSSLKEFITIFEEVNQSINKKKF